MAGGRSLPLMTQHRHARGRDMRMSLIHINDLTMTNPCAKRMDDFNGSLADRSCPDKRYKFRNHPRREDAGAERRG